MTADDGLARALIHLRWLRGTYLDQMITFEQVLDAYLTEYLEIPSDRRLLFRAMYLERMPLGRKAEAMSAAVAHSGVDGFEDLGSSLREAVTFRNRFAHAHLQPTRDDDGVWRSEATTVDQRGGEVRVVTMAESDLRNQLAVVPRLLERTWEFMCAVTNTRQGEPPPAPDEMRGPTRG